MKPERESKQFWAVDGTDVTKVIGYACSPNKGMWFCPALEGSCEEGYQLFNTKAEAQDAAIKEAEAELVELQKALNKLKQKRAKTK